jgi:hypothetical protein
VTDLTVANPTSAYRDLLTTGARRFVQAGLLLLIVWLLLMIVAAAMSRSLEFDGAMNLLMSRSIAEGNGPREVYDSRDLFPAAVQTKAPFVLLGALVFKLFGVGQLQTQLPNLIYLGLLCAVLLVTLRRLFGTTTSLLATVLLLASPSITQYGLRGYGELPALLFGLAALSVVAWPGPWHIHTSRRCLLAGALVGLALATKVIGIVQVATVGMVLLCRLFAEPSDTSRSFVRNSSSFALGVATPLLLVELWHLLWMGTAGYRAWWTFMWSSIMSQSGATPRDPQGMLSAKIAHHFQILSTQVGLGHFAMMAAIVMPLVALAFAYFFAYTREQKCLSRWFMLGLLLLVALYFPWWLAIVPNDKAWLRYIYIGLISLEIIAGISIVANFRSALTGRKPVMRLTHLALAVITVSIYAPLTVKALENPISFKPGAEIVHTKEAAQLVSGLPADASILGYGWYAAPTVQIYTHRSFMDLTDFPIGKLIGKPAYLVADRPTLITGILGRVLARYPHRALMQPNPFAQVYAMDFANPVNPFTLADQAQIASKVVFADHDYPLTEGMEPFNPIGGRFIESDSEILLRYEGQSSFQLVGYMDAAQPSYYRWPGPLDGRIIIGHCPPLRFSFEKPGWRDFQLPLECKPSHGESVRVRILLNNVFDLPWVKDRQQAMLISAIGFVDKEEPTR